MTRSLMTRSAMTHVLLVCRANLCRSPMALAVMAHTLAQTATPAGIALDAAGTHAGVRAPSPDPRASSTLLRHGYHLPLRRTRAVLAEDFERCDLLLAMDHHNLADLHHRCPPAQRHKLQLFLPPAAQPAEQAIPDPYFGAPAGFERVLRLCEVAARHWATLLAQPSYVRGRTDMHAQPGTDSACARPAQWPTDPGQLHAANPTQRGNL